MFPDAFSIERLATELNKWLAQSTLKDIFSTSKRDIFFAFSEKKGFKIQFFQGQAFFQFPGIDNFPLKNRMVQFTSLHLQKVIAVNRHPDSRSFDIEFANNQRLVFKLFGKFSNIILFDEQAQPVNIFSLNHQKDLSNPLSSYFGNETILKHKFNNVNEFSKAHNWFGTDALNYLETLGYFQLDNKESIYKKFAEQYLEKELYVIKTKHDKFELSAFPSSNSIETYGQIIDALNDFSRLYIASESFKIKKQSQISNLEKQINQKQKLLNDLNKSIETIKQKRSYNQLGDLIMANLHSIHAGTSNVEVFDFYNNAKTAIKIKTDLSPQQNATLFYQKAKNEVKELEFKKKSLVDVTQQLDTLKQNLEKLKAADTNKNLKLFDKSFNNPLAKANGNKSQSPLPCRLYTIGGFEVLVGKNAKANDELLSKYANKNDSWFHAKDVSGSHVIIKNHASKTIPANVIEQVASLAAWYSKNKSNSLAQVIYTLRKYVRKPKGFLPGAVIVERETGILVEPKDY